jgi:flagellar assembly protein FliH
MQAARKLTPEDLLALVRDSAGRFQRLDATGAPPATIAQFEPRSYARPVDDPAIPMPEEPAPPPAPAPPSFTATPEPQAIDLEAERAAAFAAGHAQAMQDHAATMAAEIAAARAEAATAVEAELKTAAASFGDLLQNLGRIEADMVTTLQTAMERAVCQLAAERAGQKIDELPRNFQRRIEKLVKDMAKAAETLTIRLHPADFMAIKPHIKGFSPLATARLSPDPALGRGDLRLVMGDITLSDCIAPRTGGGLA